jgi:hypothetical protein
MSRKHNRSKEAPILTKHTIYAKIIRIILLTERGVVTMSNFKVIPQNERPYEWAYSEMMLAYNGKPKKIRLKLCNPVIMPGCHVSIFTKGGVGIYRVYWHETNSVTYSIITNMDELTKNHAELVQLFVNSGNAAYEAAIKAAKDNVTKYAPLSPVRKEEK